ncbi:hypothetical protein [Mesorhizobium sp. ANAO-SY3R2]|uniref:hypothetical protein n=1 Tax=Mesorhizobium sp. ANAO-SY3R2 TaxID=3166644 RepID=UPI00366AE6EE
MKGMLLRGVFKPLVERAGTMLAAYMIARGMDSDLTAQLISALGAALVVGLELIYAATNRHDEAARLIGHNGGPSLREGD